MLLYKHKQTGENIMWTTKYFRDFAAQCEWIRKNRNRYQITPLFVANGYAVEYKLLTVLRMA